ncbi:MAG: NAD(P)-dependent oxidoreductase [Candidatus Sungbacteria bacterium]|nr:NAD(P)-dependent oxidoreductase [Candidatus Sungbacteria bacterium]
MKRTISKNSLSSVLVTGGSGMVGSSVEFGMKPDHKEFNILDMSKMRSWVRRHHPSAILHLAAFADMEGCERNPAKAYELNVLGTYNLARVAKEFGVRLVYMSTCAVFDGKKKTPYTVNDVPAPLNVYGRTKSLGECAVLDIVPDSLVVRTGWLFGKGPGSEKKFINFCIRKLREGGEVRATNDRFGSPTYIPDLLEAIGALIRGKRRGVVHVVNKGTTSYFEVAQKIREYGGLQGKITAISGKTVEKALVKRGVMEGLITSVPMRSWQRALKDYVSYKLSKESGLQS